MAILGVSGITEWLLQRITAIFVAVYVTWVLLFWLLYPGATYQHWHDLLYSDVFRVLAPIALFSAVVHAWIGIWVVCTDYVPSAMIRRVVLGVVLLVLCAIMYWGAMLYWGVSL